MRRSSFYGNSLTATVNRLTTTPLADFVMDPVPDTLDEAIARGLATGDESEPLFVGAIDLDNYEEALADPKVQETLRRAQLGRSTGEFILWADGTWTRPPFDNDTSLPGGATHNVVSKSLLDAALGRALLLEAAVRQYAEHVWNDIEQRLSGVPNE